MQLALLSPRKSLNKAYLRVKPSRKEIERFKANLIKLLDGLDETESEEHNKNDLSDFLKNTFYQKFYLNTKGRNDLVIHNGSDAKSFAGVLVEAKKPSNKTEMIRPDNLNVKAFHELILYYLRERITNHNLEIKHLIATNIYEWYVFEASLFEKLFAQNKGLVKQFIEFEERRLPETSTDFFYKQIAEPFMAGLTSEICFTWFDFREYDKPLRNDDKKDDSKLIALYKLLSPEHLLKLPFTNDSNSLDKGFYTELLHIIGLTETKDGSKKLIGRKNDGQRDPGSLLENAIIQIDSLDMISRLEKPSRFGETNQDRLFNVSLELVITWINRILFLKLLEAQLIKYHNGDAEYSFLSIDKVKGFDSLNSLFFRVLAKKVKERDAAVVKLFEKIPYLNSSLFEPTELERETIFISNLQDECLIPIHSGTVLKNSAGKRLTGSLNGLDYLFAFLEAYDFSSEGAEEIQEENKTLINSSVLGLIFEKINGYKDGSFFTPGFITMYMCRETIRRAVVQKFNDRKGWNCQNLEDLYDKIEDKNEANDIINSLKLCDPGVGSGHYLVSALNEIIAIKSELKILLDKAGKRLKEYQVEVANDELIVSDDDGKLFEYNPKSPESQRVQETLFHEKQTIIENCLFGVDINPNSVKICRLRLWIELLKNAYYKAETNFTELETLPNIDINIKCGNSLISRYALDADIRQALKKSRFSIESYRAAIMTCRNAESKEQKREMEQLIAAIKSAFHLGIGSNDPRIKKRDQIMNQIFQKFTGTFLFEPETVYGDEKAKEKSAKEQKRLEEEVAKLNQQIEDAKNNKIYENAFEWRFEFPEVLNDEGDFVGFDVVIGNPPYKMIQPHNASDQEIDYMRLAYPFAGFKIDLFHLFFQKGFFLLKENYFLCYISPSSLLNNVYAEKLRKHINEQNSILKIVVTKGKVFEDADVHTAIYLFKKTNIKNKEHCIETTITLEKILQESVSYNKIKQSDFSCLPGNVWNLLINENNSSAIRKIAHHKTLDKFASINRGLITGDRGKYFSNTKESENHIKILTGSDILRYSNIEPTEYVLFDRPDTAGGCWDKEVHLAPYKLCIRQIGTQPVATLIENQYAVTGNVFTIINQDKELLKSFLAIINSSLIKYYWQIMFSDFKSTFPQITVFSLSQIPIANVQTVFKESVVKIVDQILTNKKLTTTSDTGALEKEVDRMVYELYGLTEEEIKIIEQSR